MSQNDPRYDYDEESAKFRILEKDGSTPESS